MFKKILCWLGIHESRLRSIHNKGDTIILTWFCNRCDRYWIETKDKYETN